MIQGLSHFSLPIFILPLLQGLEITDPGQVLYKEDRISGVVENEVILKCGPTLPDVYIWSFTKPGTETIRAVVYNFGKGPKLQPLAQDLGDLNISSSASLYIEKLPLAAEGLYTCQALYDTAEVPKLYYYYVYLRVLVPVSKPYILQSDSSAVEGLSFWMYCTLGNGTEPIHYIWEQENRSGQVSIQAESNSSLLNMTLVTRNHTGWFRCMARNEVNEQRSDRIWLDVLYGPDLPLINSTTYTVTSEGYSVLEKRNISLMCQASSNPPSQYTWFYNNSEIYSGPELTITNILRADTGYYACLAQNTYLNTQSKKTITLTVYYPPDGVPACSIFPVKNYTELAFFCSWKGGYPPSTLKWSPYVNGENGQGVINVTQIKPGLEIANNSVFTCYGSHVALNVTQNCSTRTWQPYGEIQCSANSSHTNEHVMLSCSWDGGFPQALLWWASSSGEMQGTSKEATNVLVLNSSASFNGKIFVCNAKHPLIKESKQCVIKLETPVLKTQRSMVSVYEGNDVQLNCILSKNYPPITENTWYNNSKQNVGETPRKYVLQQDGTWFNLTVKETDSNMDSGQYWCSAANAIGKAEIPILLLVMRYPLPPNVTISKLIYSGRYRTDVDMEWQIQMDANLTGFFIEYQRIPDPVERSGLAPLWQKVAENLEPSTRSYQITNLDPTSKYAFRVTAINHRTVGNTAVVMSPVSVPVSKPYIILSDSSPLEGTSVWIRCVLENGTDPIYYLWEQESRSDLVTTLAKSNSCLINITWVTRNHSGWIRCLAKNEVNEQRSDQMWLDVIYGPDVPQIHATGYSNMGFSVLEKGNISLMCQASSNPSSQYVWFYNNSQIYAGPQLTITQIIRMQSGNYTCLAQNTYLNTLAEKTITLTVYYPPDGFPSCTMFPANNYSDLALFCSWDGGYPSATLNWGPYVNVNGDIKEVTTNITRIQPGSDTANNSVFTCYGSHVALSSTQTCNTRTWLPYGEPKCSANSSLNNEYLMLSCSWNGGFPRALLWWASSSGEIQGTSELETNTLILHSSVNYSGKTFVCHSKHPLVKEGKQCSLKLEAPVLMTQHSVVSVFEGTDALLTCILSKNYPVVPEITWYNNMKQKVGNNARKYIIQQAPVWSLTVRQTDGMVDSGQYWCSATSAVGAADIPVMLLVIVPVSKPTILLSDSPMEGMSVSMRCVVEKGTEPINFTWEQESQTGLITTLAKENSSVVSFNWVSRNHTGWFRCLARNEVNQQRSDRIWLNVLFGPDLPQIDVTAYSITDRGYTALENGNISLMCQASSNPPSQYVWFYNNSQVYIGSKLTIPKILRMQAGFYACLAQNANFNTRSKKTVTITVYYPPDGAPSCSILPINNYTDLALVCTWVSGYPPPNLTWSPYLNGDNPQGLANITRILPGSETFNNSVFTCYGTHVALKDPQSCSNRIWMPYGEPQCFAYATRNNEYLMLSCSWEGGVPRALLWWVSSSGQIQGTSEENSNILVLRSSANYSGKAFICHTKHPLVKDSKQCVLKLEAPVLMTQRSMVSVFEGNDVQLTCILSKNYPAVTEITWYNNLKVDVGETPKKYILQQGATWFNLTVRETDSMVDSGQYWCSATNAVGGAEIPVSLLVKRYPMPPNVTISKITYSSQQRTDVMLEWLVQNNGDLTGFFIERQSLRVGKSDVVPVWQKVVVDLIPSIRSYKITNLDPSGKYAFRVTAVNHRTTGHPSEVKSPAQPPFKAYPAVIGAAIGGMLMATLTTVLLFIYVLRNRNILPRLHSMLFGMQNSQSRENINFPEDEVVGGAEEERHGEDTNSPNSDSKNHLT
ncbi:titin-like isoform X1 [Tachysurus fulvidraco]|uniref:titin-like isoform X1 n=1 Tax=Tachysurus fulvidraco TaxID=1234273 RepID=UPI001FEDA00F|nr:titin-like isoform X1 [Tachysurus fulvidraco]